MTERKYYTDRKYTTLLKVVSAYPINKSVPLPVRKKTRKQTIVTLAYVPDMSTVNSQAIYTMNKKDTSTKNFEFGQELMIDIAYQTSHE